MKAQATSTRSLLKLYYHTYLIEKIAFILVVQQNVPKACICQIWGSRMLDQPNKSQDPTNTKWDTIH